MEIEKTIAKEVTICPECGKKLIQPRCPCHMSCRTCGDFRVLEGRYKKKVNDSKRRT